MNGRHPWVDNITAMLQRIVHGRAAEQAAADLDTERGGAGWSLFVLPAWGWAVSRINVGRKDRVVGSPQRLLLPVRLTWSPAGVLVVAGDRARQASFTAAGMGHSAVGTVQLDPGRPAGEGGLPDGVLEPAPVWGPRATGRVGVLGELDRLVDDGRAGYWEVMSFLEGKVERALHFATSRASTELLDVGERARALDDISLETLRSTMVYGALGQGDPSPIQRLVERCTAPGTFARVDPERYILTSVRRDARAEVRKALGDPHIGSKIRAVAAELGPVGVDALIAAYRARYPGDRLSVNRALAALSVRAHPNASTYPLDAAMSGESTLRRAS